MLASHPLEFLSLTFRGLVPLHKEYRTRLRMTLFDWIGFHEKLMKKGQCRWMGVRADKNPLDAWIYQEILFEVRPEVVIEIGSYQGGSTLFLAHLLELIGDGFVISVDIDRSEYKVRHPRIIEVLRRQEYERQADGKLGAVYREVIGRHFPGRRPLPWPTRACHSRCRSLEGAGP